MSRGLGDVYKRQSQLYPDYAVLRRYLVDYGFLLRDERGLKYEVNRDVHGIES